MVRKEVIKGMEAYALLGFSEWNNETDLIQKRERLRLKQKVVANEWALRAQIRNVTNTNFDGDATSFMPIRRCRHDGINRCFFLPRRVGNDGSLAFDLVFFVTQHEELAFRFEPADPPDYSHNYPHVQFSRMVAGRRVKLDGVPCWIPDSYPAFPLPSSEPLRLFLAMLVTVHGRSGGAEKVIRDMFQRANRPRLAVGYLQTLREMLDPRVNCPKDG